MFAEFLDVIVRHYHIFPAYDDRFVHWQHGGKRPSVERQRAGVAEMRIADEKCRHSISLQYAVGSWMSRQYALTSAPSGTYTTLPAICSCRHLSRSQTSG